MGEAMRLCECGIDDNLSDSFVGHGTPSPFLTLFES
jgi:hypothetical protein